MSGGDNVVVDELAAARHEIKRIGDVLTSTNIRLVTERNASNIRRLKILEMEKEIERLKKLKDAPEMFDRYLDSIASILGRFQTIIDEVVSERGQI